MHILIYDSGSSSQYFKVFQASSSALPKVSASGEARNVATITPAVPVLEWMIDSVSGSMTMHLATQRMADMGILFS